MGLHSPNAAKTGFLFENVLQCLALFFSINVKIPSSPGRTAATVVLQVNLFSSSEALTKFLHFFRLGFKGQLATVASQLKMIGY